VADWTHFESGKPSNAVTCSVCEAMLPDAVDGMLTEAEQRAFDLHVAGCVECAQELEEAQRGAAWLSMLKSKAPEPPADLLAKILAGTTGSHQAQAASPIFSPEPVAIPLPVLAKPEAPAWAISSLWRRAVGSFRIDSARMTFQPRLAMTAAMAFFSIALTLNLAGVRLRDLRAANFTPSGLRHSVGDMTASATRSFQNLRVVYQVESRVGELRSEDSPMGDRQPSVSSPRSGDAAPIDSQPGSAPQNNNGTPNDSNGSQDKPKEQPQPLGHSDLMVPVPPRMIRGGLVARKEV